MKDPLHHFLIRHVQGAFLSGARTLITPVPFRFLKAYLEGKASIRLLGIQPERLVGLILILLVPYSYL